MAEYDSVARALGGVEGSVSLPTVNMRSDHQLLYQSHVKHHTCSDAECTDLGFVNLTNEDNPITERVHHKTLMLKQDGRGEGGFGTSDDNAIAASSKRPDLPKLTDRADKVARGGESRSESSDLLDGEDAIVIHILTKQLNASNPVNLFQPKRTNGGQKEYGLWRSHAPSSDEDGGLTGRIRLSRPELSQPKRKRGSAKLPSFLQKHVLRLTVHPVKVEFDRMARRVKTDRAGKVIDCLGTLADKGPNKTEESKLP